MQEKNLIERDSKKGGVAGVKKQKAGAKHLGINLAEILSIISLGTETGKDQKSSVAAAKQLIASAGFKNDFSSSRSLAESFQFFDIPVRIFCNFDPLLPLTLTLLLKAVIKSIVVI